MSLCREAWSLKAVDAVTRSSKQGIFELKNTEPLSAANTLLVFLPGGALHALAKVQMRLKINSSLLCCSS